MSQDSLASLHVSSYAFCSVGTYGQIEEAADQFAATQKEIKSLSEEVAACVQLREAHKSLIVATNDQKVAIMKLEREVAFL